MTKDKEEVSPAIAEDAVTDVSDAPSADADSAEGGKATVSRGDAEDLDGLSERRMRVMFYRKVSRFREVLSKQDWTNDKVFNGGSRGGNFMYVSADKMKANFNRSLVLAGLEYKPGFSDLRKEEAIGNMSQHWTLEMEVELIDIDTGYSDRCKVFGEAGNSGDKAVSIAHTYAFKNWVSSRFHVSDGSDPDADREVQQIEYRPKGGEEIQAIRSKVLASGVPAQTPAPLTAPKLPQKPSPGPVTAPKAQEAPKDGDAPKVPQKPKEAPKEVKEVKDAPKTLEGFSDGSKVPSFDIPAPYKAAVDRIVDSYRRKAEAGEIGAMEYNTMSMARVDIASVADAIEFTKKYRV